MFHISFNHSLAQSIASQKRWIALKQSKTAAAAAAAAAADEGARKIVLRQAQKGYSMLRTAAVAIKRELHTLRHCYFYSKRVLCLCSFAIDGVLPRSLQDRR